MIDGTKLYVTATGSRRGVTNDRLIAFDLTTRTSQVISSNLGIKDLYGLTMQNGKLIGYSRLGQQVTIDPITGESVIGGTLPYSSELRGVSLQTQDSTPPPFVPGDETNTAPPAPSPGQKGVPEDAGRSRKTHVSQNGVVVHYYDNGHLIVQPNGEGFWYGRVQLLGATREIWDVAPISLTDPDGDDVALRAKSLTSSRGSFSVSRSGEIGGANDQNDWYKFTITSPQLVKLKLTGAYAGSDMLLWNLLQDSSDDASMGDGDYREISRILAPGTYHIQIDGNPDRKTPYSLQVSAKGLEGKAFRGELGEAYVIENGKRWSVPFEKTEEYLNRRWDSLERMRQEDLEQIPFGGEYQTRWSRAIAAEYGATRNLLGSATGEVVPAGQSRQGTTGYWQGFQSGTIHWSAKYGAVPVWHDIQRVYGQTGGSGGWLGFPTKRERDVEGGRRTDFEGGFIFWTPQLGARAYKPGETPILTPPYTPPPITPNPSPGSGDPITNPDGFTAVSFSHTVGVDTNYGIRLRTDTYLNAPYEEVTHASSFEFDGWKYGEPVSDRTVADGRMDALWYRIKGTNHWIPSAFINGYPPNNPPTLPGGSNPTIYPITYPGNPSIFKPKPRPESGIDWNFLQASTSTTGYYRKEIVDAFYGGPAPAGKGRTPNPDFVEYFTRWWELQSGDGFQFDGNEATKGANTKISESNEFVKEISRNLMEALLKRTDRYMSAGYAHEVSAKGPYNGSTVAHAGIDYAREGGSNAGDTVHVIVPGEVIAIKNYDYYDKNGKFVPVGHFVTIKATDGNWWIYGHIVPSLEVAVGKSFESGKPIGNVRDQGNNSHLHIEVNDVKEKYKSGIPYETEGSLTNVLSNTMSPLQAYWEYMNSPKPRTPSIV